MEPPQTSSEDNKAMNNLMKQLKELQERAATQKPSVPSPRRLRTRKRKNDDSPKITSWLNKENTEKKARSVPKPKPLDVTVSKKKSKSLKRTPSFEKYGIRVPSFDKIVADQRKFEEDKEGVQQLLDEFDEKILKESVPNDCLEEEEFIGELLDCKHLTNEDINKAFERYKSTLRDIIKGKTYSERHVIYHKKFPPFNDLRCSSSLVVFTQDQIEILLKRLRSEFDPNDTMAVYFFQVLLPELCLLIFKEEHKMTTREAKDYLNKRPLDV